MSLDNWDGTARAVLFGLADATVRTMALAALAAATLAILRVKHPAARLRVWTFVLCAALLLPLADWLLPDLTVPLPLFVLTPATTLANVQIASPFSIQSVETAAPASLPMPLVLLFVYVLGVVALSVRAGRGWLAALRLEWNCGVGCRSRRPRTPGRTRFESGAGSIGAPARIGRHRCAGDDVRLASRAGVACQLA